MTSSKALRLVPHAKGSDGVLAVAVARKSQYYRFAVISTRPTSAAPERFFVGGLIVSLLAARGDVLNPRSAAGLFGQHARETAIGDSDSAGWKKRRDRR